MNSINKHKISKLLKIFVFFVQVIFTLGFSLSQNTVEKCCHMEKKAKMHSCCMEEESTPIFDHCNSIANSNAVEFTRCDCIHNIKSSDQETIVDKNYELNKFVVEFIYNDLVSSDLELCNFNINHSIDNIHSPPIFLVHSSFLI